MSSRGYLKIAAIAALGLAVARAAGAGADLYEDHLHDWDDPGVQEGLQQAVVSSGAIGVCSAEFASSARFG